MAWRGLLSKNLRELRIQFSPTAPESAGVRSFVEKHYLELKKLNPTLPILIRDSASAQPRLVARYARAGKLGQTDLGVERSVQVANLSETDIDRQLESLATKLPGQ